MRGGLFGTLAGWALELAVVAAGVWAADEGDCVVGVEAGGGCDCWPPVLWLSVSIAPTLRHSWLCCDHSGRARMRRKRRCFRFFDLCTNSMLSLLVKVKVGFGVVTSRGFLRGRR